MNVDAAAATNSRTELLKENEQLRLRLEEAETALRAMGKRRMAADVVAAPSGEIDTLRQTEQRGPPQRSPAAGPNGLLAA